MLKKFFRLLVQETFQFCGKCIYLYYFHKFEMMSLMELKLMLKQFVNSFNLIM